MKGEKLPCISDILCCNIKVEDKNMCFLEDPEKTPAYVFLSEEQKSEVRDEKSCEFCFCHHHDKGGLYNCLSYTLVGFYLLSQIYCGAVNPVNVTSRQLRFKTIANYKFVRLYINYLSVQFQSQRGRFQT